MKKVFALFILFFVFEAAVNAEVLEDFESAAIGNTLVQEGWTPYGTPTPIYILAGTLGGKAVDVDGNPGGRYGKSFVNTGQFGDDSIPGAEGYFSICMTPRYSGTAVKYIAAALEGPGDFGGSYSGFVLAFDRFDAVDNRDKVKLSLTPANYTGTTVYTTDPNEFVAGHTYQLRLQITMGPTYSSSTGTVWYRDLTTGEIGYTKSELENIEMGFRDPSVPSKTRPSNLEKLWLRMGYAGQIDNYEFGTGHDFCVSPLPAGDLNGDCKVELLDFAILAENWMECTMLDQSKCD